MAPRGEADDDSELSRLRREVVQLRKENAILGGRTQVLQEGSLMRFREQVLSQSWKKRFFELRIDGPEGATLRCFELRGKDKQDGSRGKLRMTLHITSEVEILREVSSGASKAGDPPHCFQLKLPPGSGPMTVLRLGAETRTHADSWVEALETACTDKQSAPSEMKRQRSSEILAGPPKLSKNAAELSALRPVHTAARPSVLTSEDDRGIPECNVVGIINLCITVMVVLHVRLIADNLMKYGLLLGTFQATGSVLANPGLVHCALCFVGLPVFAGVALLVELLASSRKIPELLAQIAHGLNCMSCLAIPIAVIRDTQAAPPVGMTLLMAATVLFLKVVSYSHVNTAFRTQLAKKRSAEDKKQDNDNDGKAAVSATTVAYPSNLTAKNLAWFLAFPTLIYQTSYPRTDRIRKKWLAKRIGELVVCLALMSVIAEQFVVPTLRNSSMPVLSFDVLRIFVAVMKLSLPNVYLWLFMFYALFHVWLNILAELTCFGDRLFYKEWWNATKLEDYWRLWNLPVHNWLVKHVFLPVRNAGLPKSAAVFATFFVSAVFHELLVSVPCHTIKLWSFFGMMAQLPLVHLTAALDQRLKGSQLGNVIFWISFCIVGQPLCVLLYFTQV